MMKLLVPLGLLGLIGLIALLLIYIIKPNFLTKYTSSNYIWQLALKYKKKRFTTNKVREILLIICQVLIVISLALIMAWPVIDNSVHGDPNDSVIILDSSASMRVVDEEGKSRFYRAVDLAIDQVNKTAAKKGHTSVIFADDNPRFIAQGVAPEYAARVVDDLMKLQDDEACTYTSADIDGAIGLTEDIFLRNPEAQIYLYTDSDYLSVPEGVNVISVIDENEWNIGIVDAKAELVDGLYAVTVQVALYGRSDNFSLNMRIEKSEGEGDNISTDMLFFAEDQITTVTFIEGGGKQADLHYYHNIEGLSSFSEFKSIRLYFDDPNDSFSEDDEFFIYGGSRERIDVEYVSSDPNPFYETLLSKLPGDYADRWDIRVRMVSQNDYMKGNYDVEGYDFYIFENLSNLKTVPTDGVVIIMDPPNGIIPGISVSVEGSINGNGNEFHFTSDAGHPIINNINPDNIFVTRYSKVSYDTSIYTTLMKCEQNPVALLCDNYDSKLVVLPFSLHYSNIGRRPEFVYLIYGIFDYFFPSTVQKYAYEVNENVTLNSKGPVLTFDKTDYKEFPFTLKFSKPGTYTFKQSSYFSDERTDLSIYVRLPKMESNIFMTLDVLQLPYVARESGIDYQDLLLYFAIALVALLFVEWILHSFENR